MLSVNDFKEKQLLIITAEELKNLSLRNDNIIIKNEEGVIINQMSCFKIFCIFIVGDFTITSKLIENLYKYQIPIYCLGQNFKPKFLIGSPLAGNYLLRENQYKNPYELTIAKHVIKNKGENQLLLLKSIRDKSANLANDIKNIKLYINKINSLESDSSLRGLEGNISKLFFKNYFSEQKRYKRMPKTRCDILNFLLDIGYSFLYNFIEANLCLYGFDIYKGVYHKLFYERKSLVCDLVEPFRCIIDKKIKNMYGLGQINEKDFKFYKGEYSISWEKQKPYIQQFFQEILKYKLNIFQYIKDYYRYQMNPVDKSLPYFYITNNEQC